jgi:UDP-N-acetylglucosamine transferase subunit ALG13
VILVTVGTNEQPFDRLVRAAAQLDATDDSLVVQHGASRVSHGRGRWVDFLPFDELAELIAAADVVVSHAGVGSIILACRQGKRPLVVPRRLHLREAVDDHQLTLARRLETSGMVELVEDEQDLPVRLARRASGVDPGRAATAGLPGGAALAHDIRCALRDMVAV